MTQQRRRKSNPSKLNSIRNPEGIFINTSVFREEALHFEKHGYYCPDPPNSPAYRQYWDEQLKRCTEGYQVGGVKITGHHYNYLNFTPIQKVKVIGNKVAKKITGFPDFWDGDYNYFHCINIARYGITQKELTDLSLSTKPLFLEGGKHLIVGKSRRKGYSYKNGSIAANTYNTQKKSLSIIGAFNEKYLYPEGTMSMASSYLDFYNQHTAWKKRRQYVDKVDYKKASFKKVQDNVEIEGGYLSSIIALTFKDNPDAARGKDAALVLFEESGKFPILEASYLATEPTLRAGMYTTGLIIIFGTGGDMEKGTVDFAKMFYNPDFYNLLPFENIWDDENSENSECGFFHPMTWNNDGFYDEQGNSNIKAALEYELEERKKLQEKGADKSVIDKRTQEYSIKPAESFLTVSSNAFPVLELRNRLNYLRKTNIYKTVGQPVHLLYEEGKITAKPDLKGELNPIWGRLPTDDRKGAVVIYEYPIPDAPRGLYKIGYDPYANEDGQSMACVYVYKGTMMGSNTREWIVAKWIGRTENPDGANRMFELLCELYKTKGMYENMVYHVKSYMERRKKLHLLAYQPNGVISKAVKESVTQRIYGCHMNPQLKRAGEDYLVNWLTDIRDYTEDGKALTNIDFIFDTGLLEELILYNRTGNFDRVMALMMVMFQAQEEELGKVYNTKKETNLDDLANLYKKYTNFTR